MTKESVFTANNDTEHDVHNLLSPELRQDIIRLKEQMEKYATHLDNLCRNLEKINDAVIRAQEFAECLLTDDPSGAWEVIRRSQQPNEWDPDVEDDLDGRTIWIGRSWTDPMAK
jgi:hypothetical protein